MFARYAIYYTPAPGTPFAAFGASWLGWDSATGQSAAHPDGPVDVAEITATPRKYGFHGTIKPPFRLAAGQTADGLQAALHAFCAGAAPVQLEGLELAALGRFLALVPTGDASALAALAARAVQELDPFRAAPTEAELEKRRASALSPEQEAHLERWGYPYVLDQFRFHMTLSARLDAPARRATREMLAPLLGGLSLAPVVIDALTLLGEDSDGRFHQIVRVPLTGAR